MGVNEFHADDEKVDMKPKKMTPKRCLKYNYLLIMMVIGMILGVVIGVLVRERHPDFASTKRNLMYLAFPGKLILSMLKVLIVPLIVTTLIAGVANLPKRAQGRLGGFTVAYYLITTAMAVLLGILLVATIKPGVRQEEEVFIEKKVNANAADTFLDIIRNIFPDNIIEAAFRTQKTNVKTEPVNATKTLRNGTKFTYQSQKILDEFSVVKVDRTNTLGLICFSIAFGIMISRMGNKGRNLAQFFSSFSDAMMLLTTVVVHLVPIGIVFLVASKIVATENLAEDFKALGLYMATVLIGLGIHGCIILPLILLVLARRNPLRYVASMARALITALGTASSSATMPLTLKCLRENAKVHPLVANFVIPVGATVNMDGTGLYEAVASIYLGQQLGMQFTAADYVVVSVTATLAAIGAAGIPEAGLVTMLIVLQALGIPYDSIGFILAVDWFLDRCRTSINVWGDSIGAAVVERMTKGYLSKIDAEIEVNKEEPPPTYNGYTDTQRTPEFLILQENVSDSTRF